MGGPTPMQVLTLRRLLVLLLVVVVGMVQHIGSLRLSLLNLVMAAAAAGVTLPRILMIWMKICFRTIVADGLEEKRVVGRMEAWRVSEFRNTLHAHVSLH